MRVLVAAVRPDCIASRALLAEGVEHEEHVCEGPRGYGRMVAEAWGDGGFVLVEHDVVPWVGAIRQLEDCAQDWCGFRYAKGGSTVRALGLVKFSDRLTRAHPGLSEHWPSVHWQALETSVLGAVSKVSPVCKHGPPAGHARAAG
jgi:hypothetical protein